MRKLKAGFPTALRVTLADIPFDSPGVLGQFRLHEVC